MTAVAAEQIELIDLGKLDVHPANPRKVVGDLDELAASIRSVGLIEPVVAVRKNGRFQVVAGSRRLAAARKAKLDNIPVRVMELDEAEATAAALIENLQRKDLEPLEQAEAFRGWLTLTGKTQVELAKIVGLAPSTIANALRLLEAPKLVQDALRAQTIGAEHARVALTVPAEFASGLTLKKGVTVEQLREEARDLTEAHGTIAKIKANVEEARKKAEGRPDHIVTWQQTRFWAGRRQYNLTEILGTPPAKIAGPISGYIEVGQYQHTDGNVALHDQACECRALGIVDDSYDRDERLRRVCVSPAGYKKYLVALSKERFGKGGRRLPPKQTAAAREKAKKQKARAAESAAARALSGRGRYDDGERDKKIDPKLLKGGIDGEPARLALFAIATGRSHEWDPGWRTVLWRRIAKMPIREVRSRAVEWAAAATLTEIGSRQDEKAELVELVYAHFGIDTTRLQLNGAKKAKR
jgi:ParB family chromosome partitioning protein